MKRWRIVRGFACGNGMAFVAADAFDRLSSA
jgi:hypothetical protein